MQVLTQSVTLSAKAPIWPNKIVKELVSGILTAVRVRVTVAPSYKKLPYALYTVQSFKCRSCLADNVIRFARRM